MRYVRKWAESRGIEVKDRHADGVGYDYDFIYSSGRIEKVEVKGTEKRCKIPDMSIKEFDKKVLKADFLFVVGNVNRKGEEVLYKIPREAIKPKNLRSKKTYHIARFQNKKTMERYIVG